MDLADDTGQPGRPGGALLRYLEPLLAQRHASLDAAQLAAVARLQRLADELGAFELARGSTLKRLFAPPEVPRGLYLYGGVGRGKSFLMDSFYAVAPVARKTRIHFHAFMRDVHESLARVPHEEDPLSVVAAGIAARWRLVCFDEFHVSDIADAMILGRLLDGLMRAGVVLVTTSNYRPDDLWPNGLLRERFLPAIALIRQRLDVLAVDAGVDYRLRALEQLPTWHVPRGPAADAALAVAFDAMTSGPDETAPLTVEGRPIAARRRAGGVAWFDFRALCDGPRSQRDYLEIARRFGVVLVSDIPRMGPDSADQARRFTWLVDILYDHRVKLIASAEAPAEALYAQGPNAQDFPRTVSRLVEMRTREYRALPHVREAAPAGAPA